jgi:hypothetical protein
MYSASSNYVDIRIAVKRFSAAMAALVLVIIVVVAGVYTIRPEKK